LSNTGGRWHWGTDDTSCLVRNRGWTARSQIRTDTSFPTRCILRGFRILSETGTQGGDDLGRDPVTALQLVQQCDEFRLAIRM
jgi:hypothetical protein